MITDYFSIDEMVCPHVVEKYKNWEPCNNFGHFAWNFFDMRLLVTLEIIHKLLDKSILVNNYKYGGNNSQRGFRCVKCQLMQDVYMSGELFTDPHALGKAVDFNVMGMSAEQVRQFIIGNKDHLPYPIRMERGVNWVHIDVCSDGSNKIIFFDKPKSIKLPSWLIIKIKLSTIIKVIKWCLRRRKKTVYENQ
jgi:hypothetical protein